jgi:hypothetical protein
MKIAITCDHLIQRMEVTSYVEALLALYPKAEIFTFVHNAGKILGDIEHHKIHSTFLTHKVKSIDSFNGARYLLPSTQKNFAVPCSFDLVFNISTGFSQSIQKCEDTRQITYLLQWPFEFEELSWKQKLFKKYLESWALKGLNQADEIWVARPSLEDKCRALLPNKKIKQVMPFFNLDDYPIIPSSHWKHDVLLISTEGISSSFALIIYDALKSQRIKFLFVGLDNHLEQAKKTINDDKYFFGQRCAGDLAPLMASCLGAVDFSHSLLPGLAVRSLAAGRPVALIKNGDYEKQLDQKQVFWLKDKSADSLLSFMDELKSKNVEPKELRRSVLKFNPASFKTKVKNNLASLESVFN